MELLCHIHTYTHTWDKCNSKKDGINEHTLKRKQNYALCNLVSRDQQTDRRTEVRAKRERKREARTHMEPQLLLSCHLSCSIPGTMQMATKPASPPSFLVAVRRATCSQEGRQSQLHFVGSGSGSGSVGVLLCILASCINN